MKKRSRLLRGEDFTRLLAGQRLWAGRTVVAFAVRRPDHARRIGVTATRRLPGAVERNLARRRLREAARVILLASPEPEAGYDLVLVARQGAVTLPWEMVRSEVASVAVRLAGSAGSPS